MENKLSILRKCVFAAFALLIGFFTADAQQQSEQFETRCEMLLLGDYPVGESEWTGEIKATGNYKIKVHMTCVEGFDEGEFEKLKPKFTYSPKVQTK